MSLHTDDDVERLRIATRRAFDNDLPVGTTEWAQAVLDAVLPAYRKRLLNELADKIEDSPFPRVPAQYIGSDWLAGYEKADALTVDMLRAKAEEMESWATGSST